MRRTRGLHRVARAARAVPGGRAGRLHQRRQIDAVQRADRRRGDGARPVVRHARSRRCAACGCRPGGASILSDTVGFISELPTELVAAFRATLEEVAEADVILHVRDVAASRQRGAARRRAGGAGGHGGRRHAGCRLAGAHHRGAEQGRPARRRRRTCRRAPAPSRSRPSPARGWRRCRPRSTRASPPAWNSPTTPSRHGDGARLAWLYQHGEVVDARTTRDDAVHVTRAPAAGRSRAVRAAHE